MFNGAANRTVVLVWVAIMFYFRAGSAIFAHGSLAVEQFIYFAVIFILLEEFCIIALVVTFKISPILQVPVAIETSESHGMYFQVIEMQRIFLMVNAVDRFRRRGL